MTKTEHIISDIDKKFAGRRGFLHQIGLASAGIGAFLAIVQSSKAATITDPDIVQFALNLQ